MDPKKPGLFCTGRLTPCRSDSRPVVSTFRPSPREVPARSHIAMNTISGIIHDESDLSTGRGTGSPVQTPDQRLQESPAVWPRLLVFPISALFGHALLVLCWSELSGVARFLSVLGCSYAWYCVGGCFHECVHLSLSSSRRFNVWLGRYCGMITVIPFTLFRATHLTHHASMSTPRDYELWPYCDPKYSRRFRSTFAVLDLVLATITAPVIYGRIFFSDCSVMSRRERQSALWEYGLSAVFWSALSGIIAWLLISDRLLETQLSVWWIAPLCLSASMNTVRKMIEHIGLSSTDYLMGTRTVLPGNAVTRAVSYFNFAINIHGPHHRHGAAKYFELESKLEECLSRQPEATATIFPTYTAAAWSTLKDVLHNPGVGSVINPATLDTVTAQESENPVEG